MRPSGRYFADERSKLRQLGRCAVRNARARSQRRRC